MSRAHNLLVKLITKAREESYIPPKRPYSFLAMLDDILDFAALHLVENGRLSFWMPTANDEDQEIQIPQHHCLQITSVCTQAFNKCRSFRRDYEAMLTIPRVKETNNLQETARFRGCS